MEVLVPLGVHGDHVRSQRVEDLRQGVRSGPAPAVSHNGALRVALERFDHRGFVLLGGAVADGILAEVLVARGFRRVLQEDVEMSYLLVPEEAPVRVHQIVSADHPRPGGDIDGASAESGLACRDGGADYPEVYDVRPL